MSDEGRVFVDTNILVYAHDVSAQEKHVRARELLRSARALGCAIVWSEDLNAGQHYDNVQVVNPLI